MNKKAFEQYNNFTSQRDSLTKRRKELDDSQSSIQDLVEVLDQRKDEAIERTFKQVSKEFAQIFERLVPAGKGRLVIQRKTDQRAREDDDSDEEPRESVENYTGVGISVSFNSKHDEQQRIQQLSGGQKSQLPNPILPLTSKLIITRSLRPCSRLRNPAMRSRTLLSLRRNRRKPRRAVSYRRCTNASRHLCSTILAK